MARNLTDKELREFSATLTRPEFEDDGNLTREQLEEFRTLDRGLTRGSVPFAEPVRGGEKSEFDVVDFGRAAGEKAKAVGRGAVEFGKQLTRPRIAGATIGGALGSLTPSPQITAPAGAAAGSFLGTVVEELGEAFERGAPDPDKESNPSRDFIVNEVRKAGGPVFEFIQTSNRLVKGIKASPEFFPPFTEDEKALIQNGMESTALASQLFRGQLGTIGVRAGRNAVLDASLESLGLNIAKTITRANRGGFFKVSPQAQEVVRIVKPIGGTLNLPQLVDNRIVDFIDNVNRAGVMSAEIMQRADDITEGTMRRVVSDMNDSFMTKVGKKMDRSEVAAMTQGGLDVGQFAAKAFERKLYQDITKEARRLGVAVPASKIKLARARIRQEFEKKFDIGFGDQLKIDLNKLDAMPNQIDFDAAHGIRSEFKSMARHTKEDSVRRSANIMVDAIGGAMDDALKAIGPEGATLKRMSVRADRFFRFDKKVFEDDFMAKLFINNKKSSQVIGEAIYKNGNVDEVKKTLRAVRRADLLSRLGKAKGLKDPLTGRAVETFDAKEVILALKQGYNNKFLNKHFRLNQTATLELPGTEDRGLINWETMLQDLGDDKTRETMTALFGRDHHRALVDLAKSGQFLNAKSPGNANALALATMSATIGVPRAAAGALLQPTGARAGLLAKSLASLLGIFKIPGVFANRFTNPVWIKWAINGQKELAKGTQVGIQAFFTSMSRATAGMITSGTRAVRELDPFTQPLVPDEEFRPNQPREEIQP